MWEENENGVLKLKIELSSRDTEQQESNLGRIESYRMYCRRKMESRY